MKTLNRYERIVWRLIGAFMGRRGYKYLTIMRDDKEITAFIFDSIKRDYTGA